MLIGVLPIVVFSDRVTKTKEPVLPMTARENWSDATPIRAKSHAFSGATSNSPNLRSWLLADIGSMISKYAET